MEYLETCFRESLRQRYKINEIANNRNSLFAAIALAVYGNVNQASTVRADVKRHIMGRLNLYRPFFMHNASGNIDNEMLCKVNLIGSDGEAGGQESLAAACRIYGITIIVEDVSGRKTTIKEKGDGSVSSRVYLSCHFRNHFNVLTRLVHEKRNFCEDSEIFEMAHDGYHDYSSMFIVSKDPSNHLCLSAEIGELYLMTRSVYPCGLCRLTSISQSFTTDHVILQHGYHPAFVRETNSVRYDAVDKLLFRCYVCESSFDTALFACLHVRDCH